MVVVGMMVDVVTMIVGMMVAVPSCGWYRTAGRDYANNT